MQPGRGAGPASLGPASLTPPPQPTLEGLCLASSSRSPEPEGLDFPSRQRSPSPQSLLEEQRLGWGLSMQTPLGGRQRSWSRQGAMGLPPSRLAAEVVWGLEQTWPERQSESTRQPLGSGGRRRQRPAGGGSGGVMSAQRVRMPPDWEPPHLVEGAGPSGRGTCFSPLLEQ